MVSRNLSVTYILSIIVLHVIAATKPNDIAFNDGLPSIEMDNDHDNRNNDTNPLTIYIGKVICREDQKLINKKCRCPNGEALVNNTCRFVFKGQNTADDNSQCPKGEQFVNNACRFVFKGQNVLENNSGCPEGEQLVNNVCRFVFKG